MKDICIWLVVACMLGYPAVYIYQIRKKLISPTLSTWIIFQVATIISLISYAIAEHSDFRSGIVIIMDTLAVFLIIIALVIWGDRKLLFKWFEKWYLAGLCLIVLYGLITGNAWRSNILAQGLITLGYIPTFHNLIYSKRNNESFLAWACVWFAAFFGLLPSMVNGNFLAALYTCRGIISVSITLSIMFYYHYRSQKKI